MLEDGAEPGETVVVEFDGASASDTFGVSASLNLEQSDLVVNDCCVGDCNDDGRVDIADAVSVILELSDMDGDGVCDTQGDVPFEGTPCCDCNTDQRIDMADAVCIVNGIGDLECPATPLGLEAAKACEIQIGAIDLQRPSAVLPAGQVAEVVFTATGGDAAAAAAGATVRPGDPRALSFADVLAVSHPGTLKRE